MPTDIFLKIEGIKGESKDKKHPDEIEISSFSWGMNQTGSFGTGGGGGSGKVHVQDVSFQKYIDKATAELQLHCCNGKHIPEAVLTVRKAGENPLEYLKITFNDLLVSHISQAGASGDKVVESFSINFTKYKSEYVEQKADGSGHPPVTAGYDLSKNEKV
jgi:type VI secretion system secreted protein Hcp